MHTFNEFREIFADFYLVIKEGHEKLQIKHRGHGLDHDVTVAMLAVHIAPDKRSGSMAWCAAMIHSTDRIVTADDNVSVRKLMQTYLVKLPKGHFTPDEIEEIFTAALNHSEKNKDGQSLTQQILMDADRLANLMLSLTIRGGQFRPEIPALEFEYLAGKPNPRATYPIPSSVLDNIRINITEYIPQLRLEKAKKIGKEYAADIERFIATTESQYRDIGLTDIRL
ncbi:MAG TPA: hypothetical protein VMR73_00670 [Candidatus Paceibacterota bacterium]|nr:hypothetical protein [Candidatus Paceibacterota bacterium]